MTNSIIRILILVAIIFAVGIGGASAGQYDDLISPELKIFFETDTTDENKYLPWYTCGHFTRELAHNASDYNITIGGAILSNYPVFRGYENHIINYIEINDTLYFIEPQTDRIMLLDEIFMEYQYIRLYPDGTQVPSNWRYNLAPTLRSDELL